MDRYNIKNWIIPPMPSNVAALMANPAESWKHIADKLELPKDFEKYFSDNKIIRLTSFPRNELRRGFLGVHKSRHQYIIRLGDEATQMLKDRVTLPEIIQYVKEVAKLIADTKDKDFPLHPQLQISVPIEITHQVIWYALKKNKDNPKTSRILKICDTSLRDLPQSEHGRNMPLDMMEAYYEKMLSDEGHPEIFQTGGGATVQFGFLKKIVGENVRSPFDSHRALLAVHKKVFLKKWGQISQAEVPQKILNRFEPSKDRCFLSEVDFDATLEELSIKKEVSRCLKRLYYVRQAVLTRGEFGVALEPQNPQMMTEFLRQLKASGADVIQVFDWRNYFPNLKLGLSMAHNAGLELIPMIHADPSGKLGVFGYKHVLQKLKNWTTENKARVFAWGIKDAPGIVTPEHAFETAKMLDTELERNERLQFHSHDTGGQSILSYASFLLGLNPSRVLFVDVCMGDSQRAQADIRSVVRIFSSSEDLKAVPSRSLLAELSDEFNQYNNQLREEGKVSKQLTARQRVSLVNAGLAGGASETLRRDFGGYVDAFLKKFELGEEDSEIMLDALMEQVLLKMPEVDKALGTPCKVTPGMNWIGDMSLRVLVVEIMNDCFSFSGGKLKRTAELPINEWPLPPPLENHIWEVLQDDFLKKYYEVDSLLQTRCLGSLGERVAELGKETGLLPDQCWRELKELARFLGRENIDRITLDVAKSFSKTWHTIASSTNKEDTLSGLGFSMFYSKDYLKKKYNFIEDEQGKDWENFLIRATFGKLGEDYYNIVSNFSHSG